jgi:hypothetical protein
MKLFKSNKNQPKWTKKMSILSLSVVMQTQACAGTKVEMMKWRLSPSTTTPRDPVLGGGNRCDWLVDRKLQEAYKHGMSSLELDKNLTGIDFLKRDEKGENLFHRAARNPLPILFEKVLITLLRWCQKQNINCIHNLLVKEQQSKLGSSTIVTDAEKQDDKQAIINELIRTILFQRNFSGKSVLAIAASSVTNFQNVLKCIKCYLTSEDKVRISEELVELKKIKELKSDLYCDLMAILMANNERTDCVQLVGTTLELTGYGEEVIKKIKRTLSSSSSLTNHGNTDNKRKTSVSSSKEACSNGTNQGVNNAAPKAALPDVNNALQEELKAALQERSARIRREQQETDTQNPSPTAVKKAEAKQPTPAEHGTPMSQNRDTTPADAGAGFLYEHSSQTSTS